MNAPYVSPSINVHCEVWHKRKLMSQILSRFSLGSHHSIIQPDKQLSLRTAKITQRAALTSCLRLQISCHFHIHFSVTAYVWESVRVLWGAGVAALQACQHLPLLLTPPGDAAIQKCPSVLLPPPAWSVWVCAYTWRRSTHIYSVNTLQDCLWFAVAVSSLHACKDSANPQLLPSVNRDITVVSITCQLTRHLSFHL